MKNKNRVHVWCPFCGTKYLPKIQMNHPMQYLETTDGHHFVCCDCKSEVILHGTKEEAYQAIDEIWSVVWRIALYDANL